MSAINMENLAITRLCLEEILQYKIELERENDIQGSVSYGLNLSIRNLENVLEIINDKLEDFKILDIVEERIKKDDGTRYSLEYVKRCIISRNVK